MQAVSQGDPPGAVGHERPGLTCSHDCAAGLRKRGKAKAVARLRARRREARGVKGPIFPKPGSVMGEEIREPQFWDR